MGHMSTVGHLSKLDLQKLIFFPQKFQHKFPEKISFFTHISVEARYRIKSVNQKDNSVLLRCTNLHSCKLCFIAGPFPQSRISCDLPGSNRMCAVHCLLHGHKGGYCNDQAVCICRD